MNINIVEENKIERCWDCGQEIDSYVYSYTIYLKDDERIIVEDIVGEDDLEWIEEEAKKEHGNNFDYIIFGEYCPHCLACM